MNSSIADSVEAVSVAVGLGAPVNADLAEAKAEHQAGDVVRVGRHDDVVDPGGIVECGERPTKSAVGRRNGRMFLPGIPRLPPRAGTKARVLKTGLPPGRGWRIRAIEPAVL